MEGLNSMVSSRKRRSQESYNCSYRLDESFNFLNMLMVNRLRGETRAKTIFEEARLKRKSELGNNQGVFCVSCTNRA